MRTLETSFSIGVTMDSPFLPSQADQTDVTQNQTVNSSQVLSKDYLLGRQMLPPWLFQAPHVHSDYSYGDQVTVVAGASAPLDVPIEADAYFLVETIQIVSSRGLISNDEALTLIQISDSSYNQPWSNVPMALRDAAGFGGNPKRLAYPNLLRPTSVISINITNQAANDQTYYVTYSGRKIYNMTEAEAVYLMRRQNYSYVMQVPLITGSLKNTRVPLQIFGGSDFLLKRMYSYQGINGMGSANNNAGTELIWQIRDTTNDRYFFNKKIAMRAIVGAELSRQSTLAGPIYVYTYGDGFEYRRPLYIRRNAILEAEIDNDSANAMPAAFLIALEGARIYDAISSPTPALSS